MSCFGACACRYKQLLGMCTQADERRMCAHVRAVNGRRQVHVSHLLSHLDVLNGNDQEFCVGVVAPNVCGSCLRRRMVHFVHERQHIPDHALLSGLPRKCKRVATCVFICHCVKQREKFGAEGGPWQGIAQLQSIFLAPTFQIRALCTMPSRQGCARQAWLSIGDTIGM